MSEAMRSDLWAMEIRIERLALTVRRPVRFSPSTDACQRSNDLEISFLLLLLHRGGAVMVDHATLPLGARGQQHFLDDVRQRIGTAFDRPGQGVTPECAKAHPAHFR